MSDFTGGAVYQSSFDPKTYLQTFCSFGSGRDATLTFELQQYMKTFRAGGVTGHTLIDIGSGPCIHQFLSACEVFEEIIASDYTDANRRELEKWLKNEPGAFDWRQAVEIVCELEGEREKWLEKEERIRGKVKRVLKCDITQSNPLQPVVLPKVDCLITSACLESACKDYEAYCKALQNITSLLKSGGHLIIVGALGSTFYVVGQQTFSGLTLDEESMRRAVIGTGYVIEKMEICPIDDLALHAHVSDTSANCFLVARKESDRPT